MLKRVLSTTFLLLMYAGCSSEPRRAVVSDAPRVMLWAWERPEDLSFIDPAEIGVAFLAQTLLLEGGDVRFVPRRQPLEVPEGTYLIAVTRIETIRREENRPEYSDAQIKELVELIAGTLERPNVRGVQIDHDAVVSERGFYRDLMRELRRGLPPGTPLNVTALASWCIGDLWLQDMDMDEAVPMAFEMGADTERIRGIFKRGSDWREPLCGESQGVSLDERPIEGLPENRRIYYFKNSPWSPADLKKLGQY